MDTPTLESAELYERLHAMSEEEREALDPICEVFRGRVKVVEGAEVLPSRIFALLALDLCERWQREIWERD